jgi:hypothetical protein
MSVYVYTGMRPYMTTGRNRTYNKIDNKINNLDIKVLLV